MEHQIAAHAARQRHQNADHRNDEGCKARGFELLQIGVQTRIEHQNNDANLRRFHQKISLSDPRQAARANEHAGDQCADDLRHVYPFRGQAKNLGKQHDDRNRQKKIV